MKLYCLDGGYINTEWQFLVAGYRIGEPFKSPMCMFLIDHPKGKVLFDTGLNIACASDPYAYYSPEILGPYKPVMTGDQAARNVVTTAGFKPEDIDFVVISHLHFDHTGGIGDFPNATYIVHQRELEYAYNPPAYQLSAYLRKDFDGKGIEWQLLRGGLDGGFDLFDDDIIRLFLTPGHTAGHMSMRVKLPKTGPVMLTQDACYTTVNLSGMLPGLMDHAEATLISTKFFQFRQKTGTWIIPGHDPEVWPTLKKAPEYYD
jgi:glyoxylase-like metal-dependent hydrolase (beta-lactamase superfamily II)